MTRFVPVSYTHLVEDNGKAVVSIQVTQKAAVRKNANPFKGIPKDKLDELRRFGFPFPCPGPDGFEDRMPLFVDYLIVLNLNTYRCNLPAARREDPMNLYCSFALNCEPICVG